MGTPAYANANLLHDLLIFFLDKAIGVVRVLKRTIKGLWDFIIIIIEKMRERLKISS